jgi:hypothetical protein
MRFIFPYFFLFLVLFLPFSAFAAPSNEFWNPFRGSKINFTEEINSAIQKVLTTIEEIAGRAVSKFRISDPANYGVSSGAYNTNNISAKSASGIVLIPASPIKDTSSEGTPCGGGSGDPFWANDCSCVCSKGKVHDLVYEVSSLCPEDDNRNCEDCRDITRHDNRYTKVSECKTGF